MRKGFKYQIRIFGKPKMMLMYRSLLYSRQQEYSSYCVGGVDRPVFWNRVFLRSTKLDTPLDLISFRR